MGIGAVILERGAVERVVGEGGELGVLGGWDGGAGGVVMVFKCSDKL